MRRGDVFFGGKKVFFSTERERRKKKSNGSIKSLEPVCLLFIKSMARASLLPLPRSIRGMKPSLFLSPLGGGGEEEGGTGGGGFGEGGKGGGAARAAFSDFLSSPATFNSSPFPLSASANPRGTDNSAPLPTRLAYYFY